MAKPAQLLSLLARESLRDHLTPKLPRARLPGNSIPEAWADILLAGSDCADQALRCPRKRGHSNLFLGRFLITDECSGRSANQHVFEELASTPPCTPVDMSP